MPTIIKNVSARNEEGLLVRFVPGDELPEWAIPLITNPAVLAEAPEPTRTNAAPQNPADGDTAAESAKPKREDIVARAKELGIPAKGKSEHLLAAIAAKEAEQNSPAGDPESPEGDGANTRADLERKAKELGIEFTGETSEAELELALASADNQE